MNTWQTELLKELKTQPANPALDALIMDLEHMECDPEKTSELLHAIGFGYFAHKTMDRYYHERAQSENNLL